MTPITRLLICSGLALTSAAAIVKYPHPAPDTFVVHEWGTFTSMQGAEGGTLEGMQHESEELPAFVHSRTQSRVSPFHVVGDGSRNVPVRRVRTKMETPVLYF